MDDCWHGLLVKPVTSVTCPRYGTGMCFEWAGLKCHESLFFSLQHHPGQTNQENQRNHQVGKGNKYCGDEFRVWRGVWTRDYMGASEVMNPEFKFRSGWNTIITHHLDCSSSLSQPIAGTCWACIFTSNWMNQIPWHQKTCRSSLPGLKNETNWIELRVFTVIFCLDVFMAPVHQHDQHVAKRLDEASTSASWACMAVLLGNFFKLAFAVFTELRVYSELKSCRTGTYWQLLQKQWKILKHWNMHI